MGARSGLTTPRTAHRTTHAPAQRAPTAVNIRQRWPGLQGSRDSQWEIKRLGARSGRAHRARPRPPHNAKVARSVGARLAQAKLPERHRRDRIQQQLNGKLHSGSPKGVPRVLKPGPPKRRTSLAITGPMSRLWCFHPALSGCVLAVGATLRLTLNDFTQPASAVLRGIGAAGLGGSMVDEFWSLGPMLRRMRRSAATETTTWLLHGKSLRRASMEPSLCSDGNAGPRATKPRRTRRFNGAVALQRRKHDLGGEVPLAALKLQWSRRSAATETRCGMGASDGQANGFNGAVALQRRKHHRNGG